MKKSILILSVAFVLLVGHFVISSNKPVSTSESINQSEDDNLSSEESSSIAATETEINPVSHASFVLTLGDRQIFNDPTGESSLYASYGEPTIILISDIHGDHLNVDILAALIAAGTTIIAPQAVADEFPATLLAQTIVLNNGETTVLGEISIEAIPMYNLPESEDSRHIKGRGNGYVLTSKTKRIYIAGDTADISEMRALEDIDIAFVPMNLPYTMSVEDAADAVLDFAPTVVYPYHYRGQDGMSDVEEFKRLVNEKNSSIDVRLIDWYPVNN